MDWLEVLTETTRRVKAVVSPLVGRAAAAETYGRGAGGDPMKHIDLQAEKAVVKQLASYDLSFTLISEESGVKAYGAKPVYCVTVDPVDGTTNTVRGIPFGCTSIAVSRVPRLDAVEAAVVADLFHEATYVAEKGAGAYRNGQGIGPSGEASLALAVVGLDLNVRGVADLTRRLGRLLDRTQHVRHLGANALELCYVADGKTEAFIDLRGKLRTTDIAAAVLILQEAGAVITDPDGRPLTSRLSPTTTASFIAAGNMKLHRTILHTLEGR